jgi:predicted RNA binding protein YcfA (HicA-like mRNA interferase family)
VEGKHREKLLIQRAYKNNTRDGWYYVETIGDHHQFKPPAKKGKVTITHPVKDVPIGTVKRILKQAGITLR